MAALRPLYLHAGPHKTGSTSLQHMIDDDPGLLFRRGLYAPKLSTAVPLTKSHALLLPELTHLAAGRMDRAPHWQRLAALLRRYRKTPVITAEVFSVRLMNPAYRRAVIRFLQQQGFRPHLIYILRDQPGWINSTYVQETKRFYTPLDFPAYLEAALAHPRFDLSQMVAPFIGHPDCDLTVLSFPEVLRQGILPAFLAALGGAPLTPDEIRPDRRDNPNAGVKAVHLGRRMAARLQERGLNPKSCQAIYGHMRNHADQAGWSRTPFIGFDPVLAAEVRAHFAAGNDRVAQAVWGAPWGTMVPPEDQRFVPARFDPARATAAELAELDKLEGEMNAMADLIADLRQEPA